MRVTEAQIEAAAMAIERSQHPYWDDDQFDTWWHHDPEFISRVKAWSYFTGTQKQKVIFEARLAIQAFVSTMEE